jgi:hypothetical protein
MMTAEELLERLKSVLPEVQLSLLALRGIVTRYADKASIPFEQNRASMNGALREVGMDFSRPLRAELVICQIFIMTHSQQLFVRTVEDITRSFDFELNLVLSDPNLALFASYMDYALMLVRAKGHMDFIINDVVAPLSEKLSGRRFPSGGGSESVATMMRYKIFEQLTGLTRPKNVPMGAASSDRDQDSERPHKIASSRPASATDISVMSNEDDYPHTHYSAFVADSTAAAYVDFRIQHADHRYIFDSIPVHHDHPGPLYGSQGFSELPWDTFEDALLADAVAEDSTRVPRSYTEGSLLDDCDNGDLRN